MTRRASRALAEASRLSNTDPRDSAWGSEWARRAFPVPQQQDWTSCGVFMLVWIRAVMESTAQGKSVARCKVRLRDTMPFGQGSYLARRLAHTFANGLLGYRQPVFDTSDVLHTRAEWLLYLYRRSQRSRSDPPTARCLWFMAGQQPPWARLRHLLGRPASQDSAFARRTRSRARATHR